MNDLLVRYVKYNNWANARLVATAEKLTPEQIYSGTLSQGNAFETLRHVLDVEWSWRMACQGEDVGTSYIWEHEALEDLASVRARWQAEGEILLNYVQSLSGEDLAREVSISTSERPYVIQDIILHTLNHATNHRSELGWYFTGFGHSPGDLEFLGYVRTQES